MTPEEAIQTCTTALRQALRAPDTVKGANTPSAITEIANIVAPATYDGSVTYTMRVTLLIQRGDQRNSQERAWQHIDPTAEPSESAFAALLSMDNGGPVSFEGPGTVEFNGQQYVGGFFSLELYG